MLRRNCGANPDTQPDTVVTLPIRMGLAVSSATGTADSGSEGRTTLQGGSDTPRELPVPRQQSNKNMGDEEGMTWIFLKWNGPGELSRMKLDEDDTGYEGMDVKLRLRSSRARDDWTCSRARGLEMHCFPTRWAFLSQASGCTAETQNLCPQQNPI